MIKVEGLDLEC